MADSNPPDPGAAFREWVTQWERNFDSLANQFMGTEGFSQAMNEFQKNQLNAQRMFAETMAQILTNLNMPTREDVLRLSEAVQGLDRRLERIEETLGGAAAPQPSPAKRPARTRQPPAHLLAEHDPQPQPEKHKAGGKKKAKAKTQGKGKKDE